jgi:hypothetical protein
MSHYDKQRDEWDEEVRKKRREPTPMTRAELIAELERLAKVFEGHPAHIGMSGTLQQAVRLIKEWDAMITTMQNAAVWLNHNPR